QADRAGPSQLSRGLRVVPAGLPRRPGRAADAQLESADPAVAGTEGDLRPVPLRRAVGRAEQPETARADRVALRLPESSAAGALDGVRCGRRAGDRLARGGTDAARRRR